MKAIGSSFMQMLLFVRRDRMLLASCLAPVSAGLLFKFGIPAAQNAASRWTGHASLLTPYFGLFDLFLSMLTPVMVCFAAAMVMLEEHDDRIDQYLFVTALGQKGYLLSRIGIPSAAALIATLLLLPVFKLTSLSVTEMAFLSVMGALQGVITALLIVTLSTNKLEGMAVTKIASLTMMGALVPYFVPRRIQYAMSFLPSFWAGKAIHDSKLSCIFPAVVSALIWIIVLMKKYLRKLT